MCFGEKKEEEPKKKVPPTRCINYEEKGENEPARTTEAILAAFIQTSINDESGQHRNIKCSGRRCTEKRGEQNQVNLEMV